MSINLKAVLRHASALQRATTLSELVALTWSAVRSETRYRTAWLALVEPADPAHFRVVQVEGSMQELVLERCPKVAIAGDAMLHELIEGKAPVLVLEAAADPRTNKAMVAALGNRTILNVPMVLGPVVVGALGVGTFGDEGVLAPTDDEVEALVILATQLAGAITRMSLLDAQRQDTERRQRLERHLESLQRVELMGVLAAGVAHDLNNYLTVAQANLGLLELSSTDTDHGLVDAAMQATQRASDVVRQLLSLGRAQSLNRERVDLQARVAGTVRLVRSSMPANVTLTRELGGAPPVIGDPVQIEQALANLLINAREAVGNAGAITIGVHERVLNEEFVRAQSWARTGRFACVSVSDTGAGIPADVLPSIYDPLFSTKTIGTGLGLAVVSRVVQQHAGLIHCESTLGHGTRFELYFPVDATA
ncbi:ATP-binding protein [Gemmatimonas sp.]|uniref:ATP-binding protein n=1 Tax=Gemmatimonas sp. TaxID=1962908 RepID=UPI00286CF7CE|nr:ATP-binding protein [Gemmatimonas sp.]